MKLKKNKKRFRKAEDNAEEDLFEDSEEDYEPEDEEDISLEADNKDGEDEKTWEYVKPKDSEYKHKKETFTRKIRANKRVQIGFSTDN